MGCCTKGGSSDSMQHVWKEGGCELHPICNIWLLGTWVMFGNVRKFGESGTEVCKVCRGGGRKAADEFPFEDVVRMCW